MYAPQTTISSVTVEMLALVAVSGREVVPLRPFVVALDSSVYSTLRPSPNYTVTEISGGIASGFRPDMHSAVAASIPNGWGTDRYRYVLQARVKLVTGLVHLVTVTGFSEYVDPSYNMGTVDPNLVFHIDNISTQVVACGTIHAAPMAIPAAGNQMSMMHSGQDAMRFMQRPVDVFTVSGAAQISSATGGAFAMASNTLHPLGQQAVVDRAVHAVPTRYAYALMSAAVSNSVLPDGLVALDEPAYRQNAITQQLAPPPPTQNQFIAAISRAQRDITGANIGRWTLANLMEIDPTLVSGGRVTVIDERGKIGDFGTMADTSKTAQIAASYAQSVPALMMASNLQSLHFQQFFGGDVVIIGCRSVTQNQPMERQMVQITTALKSELWVSCSHGGQYPFMVDCNCSLYSDIVMTVTDPSGRQERYRYPAWAMGTYSPAITADPKSYMETATQIAELMDVVGDINNAVNMNAYM